MEDLDDTTSLIKRVVVLFRRNVTSFKQRSFEVIQHGNKMDEDLGLIYLQVSESLQFHFDGCNTHLAMWIKLHCLFGIVNEFRELQIEVELTSLLLDYFHYIEDFLMKFKQ